MSEEEESQAGTPPVGTANRDRVSMHDGHRDAASDSPRQTATFGAAAPTHAFGQRTDAMGNVEVNR